MSEHEVARGDRASDGGETSRRLGELETQVAALSELVRQLFALFEVSPNEAR